jgi:hypothetical protein
MTTVAKSKGGRPRDEVWTYFTQGERDSEGHASAVCSFCNIKYNRAEMTVLKGHLANHCSQAPADIIRKYLNIFEQKSSDKTNKKRKVTGQTILDEYHDIDEPLPKGRIDRINRALIKLFVCCGIAFHIVESPFFIDFLKELNSAYDPPSREILSNRIFEGELGNINSKVAKELEQSDNLTLGNFIYIYIFLMFKIQILLKKLFVLILALDGWTSPNNRSIWNFTILTPNRKEYIFRLSDLSIDSHTGDYIASQIEDILDKVGSEKFAAIISDNGSNVRKARQIITDKYPSIENVRCISHCINLVSSDIVKHPFADKILKKVNILGTFFKNNAKAGVNLN